MAALGLRCCARAFSSHGKRGGNSSLRCAAGFSLQWLLLLQSTGSRAQAQQLWRTGLVATQNVGSSRTRARTGVPCIGRRILNHCATREVGNHCLGLNLPTFFCKHSIVPLWSFRFFLARAQHEKAICSETVLTSLYYRSAYQHNLQIYRIQFIECSKALV